MAIITASIIAVSMIGYAHAVALVGESYPMFEVASPPPALDQIKLTYRRPDTIPFPLLNAYTPEKALLGRTLYNDTRLSDTGALACVTCHNPGFAYGAGLKRATGGMTPMERRSPSIINNAWGESFMWDGRAGSLEEQVLSPIQNPAEMNQLPDRLIQSLSEIDDYKALFAKAFPHQMITINLVANAIATHERTIVSGYAPFDAWIDGNGSAISDAAKRGFSLFNSKANCAGCHGGWNLTDNGFHDTGLPDQDAGRGRIMPLVVKMQHAFKTPSLREIERRGPYMHDGSLPTLETVVAHYNSGGVDRASRSELITPLGLSSGEQADIVIFLRTLTSPMEPDFVPVLPR